VLKCPRSVVEGGVDKLEAGMSGTGWVATEQEKGKVNLPGHS
jgi:hypothetical protein